jgi:hypothetical protein
MKLNSVTLLLVASLAFLASAQSITPSPSPLNSNNTLWQGTWTNHAFGGQLFICQQGRQISGVFSQIGWIEGNVNSANGQSASGTFGYGGFNDDNWGTFNWTLSPSGKSFSGIFSYNVVTCLASNWSPTGSDELVSSLIPDPTRCQIATEGSQVFSGSLTDSSQNTSFSLSICIDETLNYAGTYTDENGITGAVSGMAIGNGIGLVGSYVSETTFGIEFYRPSFDGGIYLSRYPGVSNAQQISANLFQNAGVTYTLAYTGQTSNEGACTDQIDLLPTWEGVWTDLNFGFGRTYLCQSGNKVWGIYSEVGWVEAETDAANPLIINGRFYDAGDPTSEGRGNFTLELSPDRNSFVGSWVFEAEVETYVWADRRVSTAQPTAAQCATLPTNNPSNATLHGIWTYQINPGVNITMELCINDNTGRYEYSYSSTSSILQGYGQGWVEQGGQSLRGQWYVPNEEGIEIIRMENSTGLMLDMRWNFNFLQSVEYFPCIGKQINAYFSTHAVNLYYRTELEPVRARCARNSFLSVGVPDASPQPSAATPTRSRVPISSTVGPNEAPESRSIEALLAVVIAFALFVVFF